MLHEIQISNEARKTTEALLSALPESILNIQHGLYVFLFDNPSEIPIRDNNARREKIVVPANGGSVKPGKFEGSFKARIGIYANHLHHLHAVQNQKVFNLHDCLLGGVVLDLSHIRIAGQLAARVFEEYWIAQVKQFVDKEMKGLPIRSRGRLEWIPTMTHDNPQSVRERLVASMSDAAARIQHMRTNG